MDWLPFVYETKAAKIIPEWDKKYRNTYVRLNGKIVFAKAVDEPYLYFVNADGMDLRIKVDTDQVVDGSFPKIGCITHRNQLGIFTRLPNRQFKKGICSDNCRVLVPMQGTRPLGYWNLDFSVLQSAFDQGFRPPHKLLEELFSASPESAYGGAISSEWGFKQHPLDKTTAVLFFREFAVAEVRNTGDCIPIVPAFVQEISDFNRDFKVGMNIK